MKHSIYRFMNCYFPPKLLKFYGLRILFFIISTLPLYVIYDILSKRAKNPVKIWCLKSSYIPMILFTPSAYLLISFLDFSLLAFLLHIYVGETYRKLENYEPRPGWVIIDAGAYVGIYTLYVAEHAPKLVISLEPDPRSYKRFINTSRINRLKNVIILPYALTGENGFYNFAMSKIAFNSGITLFPEKDNTLKIRGVSLHTLLHALKLNVIDLLKLDVEGAEYGIISSFYDFDDCVRRIVGEVHGEQRNIDEFMKQLQGLGFKIDYQERFLGTALVHAKHRCLYSYSSGCSS